jgi:hypothetical protein
MTFVPPTDERLNAVLRDLGARVCRPGQEPYQAMQELGQLREVAGRGPGRFARIPHFCNAAPGLILA